MDKFKKPKFFNFNIIDITCTLISIFAVFSFWNAIDDLLKMIIFIGIIIILLIINLFRYVKEVKKLYENYEALVKKYQSLADNYKANVEELKILQYLNENLSITSQKTLEMLMVYNDLTKEEQLEMRKQILADIIKVRKGEL